MGKFILCGGRGSRQSSAQEACDPGQGTLYSFTVTGMVWVDLCYLPTKLLFHSLSSTAQGEKIREKLMHQNKHREHHRKNRLDLGKINFNLLPIKKMIRMVRKKNKSTFPAPHRSSQDQVLFFIPKPCSIFYLLLSSTFYFLLCSIPNSTGCMENVGFIPVYLFQIFLLTLFPCSSSFTNCSRMSPIHRLQSFSSYQKTWPCVGSSPQAAVQARRQLQCEFAMCSSFLQGISTCSSVESLMRCSVNICSPWDAGRQTASPWCSPQAAGESLL